MYRILLVSDTHGVLDYVEHVIENIRDINLIVHLGDMERDAKYIQRQYPQYECIYVRGNNDFSETPRDKFMEIEGKKFLFTHGHGYGVKTAPFNLIEYAKKEKCHAVCFGHTHNCLCERQGDLLILNPGSSGAIKPSCGIIEINGNKLKGMIYI